MTGVADLHVFKCGHPRVPENSYCPPSAQWPICRLCDRVRTICSAVLRDQAKINAGEIPGGRGPQSRYSHV